MATTEQLRGEFKSPCGLETASLTSYMPQSGAT